MPDIIVTWNEDAKLTTELLTKKYGVARSPLAGYQMTPYYTGNHRASAFMAAVGTDIPAGKVLKGTSILDLAPTILSYFGIAPAGYMQGAVMRELHAGASSAVQISRETAAISQNAERAS
jgi:hypothetical protein